jgi:hypothetical protein
VLFCGCICANLIVVVFVCCGCIDVVICYVFACCGYMKYECLLCFIVNQFKYFFDFWLSSWVNLTIQCYHFALV